MATVGNTGPGGFPAMSVGDWTTFYSGMTPPTTFAGAALGGGNPGSITPVWGANGPPNDYSDPIWGRSGPASTTGTGAATEETPLQKAWSALSGVAPGTNTNADGTPVAETGSGSGGGDWLTGIEDWVSHGAVRVTVVVLGFIFVAVGLAMFKTGASAGSVVSGAVGKVASHAGA